MSRRADLDRLYELLYRLESKFGGRRVLSQCNGRMNWPKHGVYFFFEPSELRACDAQARIVRVGTHALKAGARSTLWGRLAQHRGTQQLVGGNHRGSIFRLLVGAALAARSPDLACPTWGSGSSAKRSIRENERHLEAAVSEYIGGMTVLWLPMEDEPGSDSLRGYIEKNTIALLSNFEQLPVDPPSANWLGGYCPRAKVQRSGLWNSSHVDEDHDPAFLTELERMLDGSTS